MEEKRKTLFRIVGKYLSSIGTNTFVCRGNVEYQSVPSEWEEEQPERFERVVGELHELAAQLVGAHRDLVRTGRRKLRV